MLALFILVSASACGSALVPQVGPTVRIEPTATPKPVAAVRAVAVRSGGTMTQTLRVDVQPGTLTWTPDDVPSGSATVLSGVVVDARGSGEPWALNVTVSGFGKVRFVPWCTVDQSTVIPGGVAAVNMGPANAQRDGSFVVCSARSGLSAGRFLVRLDMVGAMPAEGTVTVRLT